MLGGLMKCLYFRSFLAFHSPVVEGDLCSFDASLPLSEQVGFGLVSIFSDHTLGWIYARFSHRWSPKGTDG